MKNHRTFDSLQKEVYNIAKKLEDERNLEESAQMWLSQAEQLREQLESNKKSERGRQEKHDKNSHKKATRESITRYS